MARPNLLESGIYTVPEAAALVATSERKIRGWVGGYAGGAEPVIENQLGWIGDRLAFSFTNLMELRFVATFSNAGIRLSRIRAIMRDVRDLLRHPHPFATNIVFRTDGRKIVGEVIAKNGGKVILDLESKNYEMHAVVLESLRDDVEFDPQGDAILWRPRPDIAPSVIVHPRYSFGHPVLRESRIPTRTLALAVRAEGNQEVVADWYDIPVRQVSEAVRFEATLRTLQ